MVEIKTVTIIAGIFELEIVNPTKADIGYAYDLLEIHNEHDPTFLLSTLRPNMSVGRAQTAGVVRRGGAPSARPEKGKEV